MLLDHSADRVENDLPYVVLDTLSNPKVSAEDKIGYYDLLVAAQLQSESSIGSITSSRRMVLQ